MDVESADSKDDIKDGQFMPPHPSGSTAITTSTTDTSEDSTLQTDENQRRDTLVNNSAAATYNIPAHAQALEFQWTSVNTETIELLGTGSYGEVYLAEVNHTDGLALKVLNHKAQLLGSNAKGFVMPIKLVKVRTQEILLGDLFH